MLALGLGGLLAGVITVRTRSLLIPIAVHIGLDIPIYFAFACPALIAAREAGRLPELHNPRVSSDSLSRPADRAVEVRVSRFVVIASAIVFGALLLAAPPFFLSFDEAKYIGIGYNVLDGLGPRSPFGDFFLLHAPVWSVSSCSRMPWFGIDPLDTGHVLNAIAGVGLVLLAGILGWRVRPAVGHRAAGVLGVTYVHDITRTARLDLPAGDPRAPVPGRRAGRRPAWGRGGRSPGRRGLRAGFLVKEVALPLAAVPVLAGIPLVGHGGGWRSRRAGCSRRRRSASLGGSCWWRT